MQSPKDREAVLTKEEPHPEVPRRGERHEECMDDADGSLEGGEVRLGLMVRGYLEALLNLRGSFRKDETR